MEEKELILKLQQLKQIKPRSNWVVFNKERILNANPLKSSLYDKIFSFISNTALQNRLSYALAMFAFVFAGLIGANNFLAKSDVSNKSIAAIFHPDVTMESFRVKSENLTQAIKKYELENTTTDEVKVAAKSLTDEINKNPGIAKEVAVELKNSGTLASLDGGTELKEASGDLYKVIDSQMIEDLERATLTDDQQEMLKDVKALYDQAKYSEALEKILLINN